MNESQHAADGREADREAAIALNGALHELNRHVRVSLAGEALMRRAEALVREASALLAPHDFAGPHSQSHMDAGRIGGFDARRPDGRAPEEVMAYSPFVGHRNPVSPRIRMRFEGGRVVGEAVFPALMAGPPSTVHGGIVAGVMDELLGGVLWLNGSGGFTATLEVRYVRPTPLMETIELRAERLPSEGRKHFARGVFLHRGEVTAEAKGVFIEPRRRTFSTLTTPNKTAD